MLSMDPQERELDALIGLYLLRCEAGSSADFVVVPVHNLDEADPKWRALSAG